MIPDDNPSEMNLPLPEDAFFANLQGNPAEIPLRFERMFRTYLPNHPFVATNSLDLQTFADLGHCHCRLRSKPFASFVMDWGGPDEDRLVPDHIEGVWDVWWNEHTLQVVHATWQTDCGGQQRCWVFTSDASIAREFILEVARQTNEPGDAVLVFRSGEWERSEDMYEMIRSTSMEELILPGAQREEMLADFHQFLAAKEQYDALGIAWRRGAILMGPPGNGKTHFLRTLTQQLKIPCLYVQCLEHPYYTSEQLLDRVFHRARQLRPALLIFEDLDSLINEENRSFFLNQLDGFEKNTGLIVVATTNHPERIDSAILDRPSRFDRKYEFGLPSYSERQRFLHLWRDKLSKLVPWDGEAIPQLAECSSDFSYAYLKELMVSSLLRWLHGVSNPAARPPFEQVLSEQCDLLQQQRMPPNDA